MRAGSNEHNGKSVDIAGSYKLRFDGLFLILMFA
jgi:hypothetical protein